MSNYLLSKTSYIKGLQCQKALFFYRHHPQLRDPIPPARQATFNRGHEVGNLARHLFPGGKDATEKIDGKTAKPVERTQELIAAGINVIYEAAFIFDEVLVLVDILVRDGEKWKAFEVKSSLRLSKSYYQDAALQYYVLSNAGLTISDFSLVHLNSDYVLSGALDLNKLFLFVSILKFAKEKLPSIIENITSHKIVLKGKDIPEVAIGEQCFSPYECDYRGQCWKHLPIGSVFELTGVNRAEQARLFNAGYTTTNLVPETEALPLLARLQVLTSESNEVVCDKEKIKIFLETLSATILFLDIENFQPAIPKYQGTKPFAALPFAYSIHERKSNGDLIYRSFLAEPGTDPRLEFIQRFLDDTQGNAIILVYDVTAERMSINLLRQQFPNYAIQLDQRMKRLRDLMQPFQQGWYHHPKMKGSISLKSVLPALVPELNYNSLAIQNGSHAMAIYEKLEDVDLFARAEKITELEAYCHLDTLAMVRVFEVLEKSIA
ncbi:MAG: DUF2779 domain-containing protein [Bacteroidetes bacterium]|nr:DUF2779 domain-containing protein [Bacteroidota bacterium]PHX83345.1 MAG: hypothetical protein CK539_00280 [Flavobacteriales bacterium]